MIKKRVIAYIDGFNLYYGLRDAKLKYCYWLDPEQLILSFMDDHQTLNRIKYYTSLIKTADGKKRARQRTFIDALGTLSCVEIIMGDYFVNIENCDLYDPRTNRCGGKITKRQEKMTDVNLAIDLVVDAIDDRYDTAIVISGDMDLLPAVKYVRTIYPIKVLSIFYPPNRQNNELSKQASGSLPIGKYKFETNQFPDVIINNKGKKIFRPEEWV